MKINKNKAEILKDALKARQTGKAEVSVETLQKRLARQAKALEEKAAKREQELEEAVKLKSMTEKEKVEFELKKLQDEVNASKKERLITQFKIELLQAGHNPDYADFINVTDAETAKKALDFLNKDKESFDNKIKEIEQQLKNASLRGSTPKGATEKVENLENSIFSAPFKNKEK